MRARDEHPSNMESMSVTEEVSKSERSTEARDEQSANMKYILVAEDVSRPERSTDFIREHFENRNCTPTAETEPLNTADEILSLYSNHGGMPSESE